MVPVTLAFVPLNRFRVDRGSCPGAYVRKKKRATHVRSDSNEQNCRRRMHYGNTILSAGPSRGTGNEVNGGWARIVSFAQWSRRALVHDGDPWRWRGFNTFSHSRPAMTSSARSGLDLTFVRMKPDVIYDHLIGAGLLAQARFLVGRQSCRGSARCTASPGCRCNGWPVPLEIRVTQPRPAWQTAMWPAQPACVRRSPRLRRHAYLVSANRQHPADPLPLRTGEVRTRRTTLQPTIAIITPNCSDRAATYRSVFITVAKWAVLGRRPDAR